jgi:hypothetical protein
LIEDKKFRNVVVSLDLNGYKDLSELLKKCIVFTKHLGSELIWQSIAEGEDKKKLVENWNVIYEYIIKYYGTVKVKNLPGSTEEERKFLVKAIELFSPNKISF